MGKEKKEEKSEYQTFLIDSYNQLNANLKENKKNTISFEEFLINRHAQIDQISNLLEKDPNSDDARDHLADYLGEDKLDYAKKPIHGLKKEIKAAKNLDIKYLTQKVTYKWLLDNLQPEQIREMIDALPELKDAKDYPNLLNYKKEIKKIQDLENDPRKIEGYIKEYYGKLHYNYIKQGNIAEAELNYAKLYSGIYNDETQRDAIAGIAENEMRKVMQEVKKLKEKSKK